MVQHSADVHLKALLHFLPDGHVPVPGHEADGQAPRAEATLATMRTHAQELDDEVYGFVADEVLDLVAMYTCINGGLMAEPAEEATSEQLAVLTLVTTEVFGGGGAGRLVAGQQLLFHVGGSQ